MEPMCRALRRAVGPPKRVWQHLAFHGVVDFEVAGQRVRMRHIGAQVENSLFWAGYGGDFEATTLLVWEQLAATAMSIYDVGANSGVFALAAKAVAPQARVDAFEPVPHIADLLEANVALNGSDIVVHRVGVSDCDGVAAIKTNLDKHDYSASLEYMEWMDGATFDELEIQLIRLDMVAAQTGFPPDLIKLDVERHEPAALRGLWPALPAGHPIAIVVEILDPTVAAAVGAQIRDRDLITFGITDGVEIRRAPLQHDPGVQNWLIVSPRFSDWVVGLDQHGGLSHAELRGTRPTSPAR